MDDKPSDSSDDSEPEQAAPKRAKTCKSNNPIVVEPQFHNDETAGVSGDGASNKPPGQRDSLSAAVAPEAVTDSNSSA